MRLLLKEKTMYFEERDMRESSENRNPGIGDEAVSMPSNWLQPTQTMSLGHEQPGPSGLDLPGGDMDQGVAPDADDVVPSQNADEEDRRSRNMDEPMGPPEDATDVDRLGHDRGEPLRSSKDDSGIDHAEKAFDRDRRSGASSAQNSEQVDRPSHDIDGIASPYRSDALTERKAMDWDMPVGPSKGDKRTEIEPNRLREIDPGKEHETGADVGSSTYRAPENDEVDPKARLPQE